MNTDQHENRLKNTEESVSGIKSDIHSIRERFDTLETSVSGQLVKLNEQIAQLSTSVNGLVLVIGERDKMAQAMYQDNKSTFERFGNKIDVLEERTRTNELYLSRADIGDIEKRVRELEKARSGSESTDKLIWAIFAGAGALVIWVLEQFISK